MVSHRQAGDHAEQPHPPDMLTLLRSESMAPGGESMPPGRWVEQ